MPIDLSHLYAILSRVAAEQRRPFRYSELSQAYADRTGRIPRTARDLGRTAR